MPTIAKPVCRSLARNSLSDTVYILWQQSLSFVFLIIDCDIEKNVKIVGRIKADYLEIRNGSTSNTYDAESQLWHHLLCFGPHFFLLKSLEAELGIQLSWRVLS